MGAWASWAAAVLLVACWQLGQQYSGFYFCASTSLLGSAPRAGALLTHHLPLMLCHCCSVDWHHVEFTPLLNDSKEQGGCSHNKNASFKYSTLREGGGISFSGAYIPYIDFWIHRTGWWSFHFITLFLNISSVEESEGKLLGMKIWEALLFLWKTNQSNIWIVLGRYQFDMI